MDKKLIIVLGAIILVGIFLRTINHHDWLHFELDQSRDAIIVSNALEHGSKNLPLLGPQARGSDLQLGPLFYYFQYGAGMLFGNAPHIFAWPDLLFGILTIPLFFLLAREFFSPRIALLLAALVASSLFFVTYSRFAWNPNALPFWITLLVLSLLSVNTKERKKRILWFIGVALSLAVIAQLHFLALIIATLVALTFIVIQKTFPTAKEFFVGVAVVLILSAPMIISDLNNEWRNTRAFIETVRDKGGKNDKHDMIEKTFRAFQKTSTFYWVTLTGDRRGGDVILTRQKNPGYLSFICDKKCKSRLPSLVIAMSAFLATLSIFLVRYKNTARHSDNRKKHTLLFLWLIFSALALIPLAYQLSARFFLILLPIFLILFGIVLTWIEQRLPCYGVIVTTMMVLFAVSFNLASITQDFTAYAKAQTQAIDPPRDLVLKRTDRVTLAQLEAVAATIYASTRSNELDTAPVVLVGDNLYVRALHYLVAKNFSSDTIACHVKRSAFEMTQTPQTYYLLTRTESDKQLLEGYKESHSLAYEEQFGTVVLYKLTAKTPPSHQHPLPPDCHTIK